MKKARRRTDDLARQLAWCDGEKVQYRELRGHGDYDDLSIRAKDMIDECEAELDAEIKRLADLCYVDEDGNRPGRRPE